MFLFFLYQLFWSGIPLPADSFVQIESRIEQSSNAEWENDSTGNFLRLKYPRGCVGTSKNHGCAVQFTIPLKDLDADELWCSYEVYFVPGFDFRNGGKLPGFCGGKCYTGGDKPKNADGWSNRIMWKKEGYLTQYVYHAKQGRKYADNFEWKSKETNEQEKVIPGKWQRIVMRVKLNDITSQPLENGQLQTWLDGKMVVDVDSLLLRNEASQKIDRFYFSTFHGGNDENYAPRWDSFIRFRNLKISRDSLLN